MNRHQTTSERQAAVLNFNLNAIEEEDAQTASNILSMPPANRSKWFTAQAVADYQDAINKQHLSLKTLVQSDPHSRRIVMVGPPGACWLSTQLLSLDYGGYHVIAYYRSLDKEHAAIDAALQFKLGEVITGGQVQELTFMIGSYHHYR